MLLPHVTDSTPAAWNQGLQSTELECRPRSVPRSVAAAACGRWCLLPSPRCSVHMAGAGVLCDRYSLGAARPVGQGRVRGPEHICSGLVGLWAQARATAPISSSSSSFPDGGALSPSWCTSPLAPPPVQAVPWVSCLGRLPAGQRQGGGPRVGGGAVGPGGRQGVEPQQLRACLWRQEAATRHHSRGPSSQSRRRDRSSCQLR